MSALRHTVITLLFTGTSVGLVAQDTRPTFDAITIRRNTSRVSSGGGAYIVNGGLQMTNVDANALIRTAYWNGADLAPSQIVDGPDWLVSETYDIRGTVGPALQGKKTAQLLGVRRLLLRSMLEDRFKLKVHRETRELPEYVLTLTTAGQLGPQLTLPSSDCVRRGVGVCSVHVEPGHFGMGYGPLAALVHYVSGTVLRRVVVDRTGLQGMFALTLEWAAADPSSIIPALQQQLGLKLDLSQSPTDVVVIDHIERPSEN